MEFVDVDDTRLWVAALRAGACTAWALSPVDFARVARRRVESTACRHMCRAALA
jgi:hypothetical protein